MESLNPDALLLVEDDEDSREILGMMLSLKLPKMTLLLAENGEAGLEIFKRSLPAVVVTDLNMPVMNGIRLIEEINAIHRGVKFILLTAFTDKKAVAACEATGITIDHCVMKPVDYQKLLVAIQQCLPRPDQGASQSREG